jgi:predicted transcriptional regulator of viral defense system
MQDAVVPIPDSLWLQNHYKSYKNPKAKIQQLLHKKALFRLKQGIYIRSDVISQQRWMAKAANRLYGPSYVSFEYALRWYGLIPEYVAHITSATYKRKRSKRFDTPAGVFFYRDVPDNVYPLSIKLEDSDRPRFLIASAEKALCDQLYTISGIRSFAALENLLFDDLRIDFELFSRLDFGSLAELSKLYRTETLNVMHSYIMRSTRENVVG